MKLKSPENKIIEAAIQKGNTIALYFSEESTGAKTQQELTEYLKNNPRPDVNSCELIEASDRERALLKEAGFTMRGL